MRKSPRLDVDNFHNMVNEWSLTNAEQNHVETIEEANDFNIPDDDSEDFLQNVTVYEMHEAAEDNLQLLEQNQKALAESNETGIGAQDNNNQPLHDQSAPNEPNSLDPTENGSQNNDFQSPEWQTNSKQSRQIILVGNL